MSGEESSAIESQRVSAGWFLLLGGLSGLAFALRFALIHSLRASPFFDLFVSDSAVYDAWARRLIAGEWLTEAGFFQAPLYPFFLAAHYKLFGFGVFSVRVTQAVLGAVACAFIAESGRRFFNRRAGLVAGIILALYPPAIFFDSLIHKPSLDLFLMSALILGTSLGATRRWLAPALAGVSLGLLMLTRENALLLVPLIGAYFAFSATWSGRVRGLRAALFVFALLLPHLLFGTWRTLPLIGTSERKASVGLPLYVGNRHGASGMYEPLAGQFGNPQGEWIGAKLLAEREVGRALNAAEISSFWTRKTGSEIFSHPLSWCGLLLRKLLMTWNRIELSDILDLRSHADFAPWLRWLGVILNFGLLAPAALWSAWMLRSGWRRWWILAAMALLFCASVVLFYVSARYRYPLVPLLAIFAGAGLTGARDFMRRAARRARFRSLLVLLGALIFANLPIPGIRSGFMRDQHSFSYSNAGVGWGERGRDGTAIGCFERALELMPDNESALFNLGEALERNGENERAVKYLAQALQLRPDRPETYAALARILSAMGQVEESRRFEQKALELRTR